MFGDTYSLRIVVDFLKSNNIKYKYCNANIGFMFQNHGCRIMIDDTYSMSIQTHPMVTGDNFAETALTSMATKKVVQDGTHGYYDVMRFYDPSELFDHILSLNPVQDAETHKDSIDVADETKDRTEYDDDTESEVSFE